VRPNHYLYWYTAEELAQLECAGLERDELEGRGGPTVREDVSVDSAT
jgi:hypothetical protein